MERYQGDKDELSSQRGKVNPVASAYLAKKEERSYNIQPQFDFQYRLLGLDETSHQLTYKGTVVLSIYNKYNDSYYPWELKNVDFKENEKGINSASSAFEKSFGFNTRHQLTYIPYIMNQDHSVRLFFKGEMVSGTSSSQFLSSYLLPSGTITSGTAGPNIPWIWPCAEKETLVLAKSIVGGIFIPHPVVGIFRMKNGWNRPKNG